MIYVIDLFCGAGGMTTGIERAKAFGKKAAKVIACVNHDPIAIKSHQVNHKNVWHFVEDIRTLEIGPIAAMVRTLRKREPECTIVLHASLDCVHYSRARAGLSKDPDSRTLYEHLERYVDVLSPDVITVENVMEFITAGPLRAKAIDQSEDRCNLAVDKNGKLILIADKSRSGEGFNEWIKTMTSYGYKYEHRFLNSADWGAHTRRIRYFGQFVRPNMPMAWPVPTHAKNPAKGSGLKKWKAVREVLDLHEEGNSIFGRKKKLVDKTLRRIYAGLIKYVAGGNDRFEKLKCEYYEKHDFDGQHFVLNTVRVDHSNENAFIQKYYSSGGNTSSINQPIGAVTTKDRDALVSVTKNCWLDKNYNGTANHQELNSPLGAITTKDHYSLMSAKKYYFLDRQFSQGGQHQSINSPAGALLTVPKMNLVSAIKEERTSGHFLVNPQYNNKGCSVDEGCFSIIARTDKAAPGIISVKSPVMGASSAWVISLHEQDSEIEILIKEFMAIFGLSDIKQRILKVSELLRIQGFPKDYYLGGNQAQQKRAIGNSVVPKVAQALIGCIGEAMINWREYELQEKNEMLVAA